MTVCPMLVLRQMTSAATALLASLASPWVTAVKVCTNGRWPGAFVCFIVVLMGGQQLASERELGVMERVGSY